MKRRVLLSISLFAIASVFLSACGKQEYKKQEFVANEEQPSFRSVPAKVDIVVVADNTGSMNTALGSVESQFSGFISGLKANYWNYRVGKVMISNPTEINKVLVNPDFNAATLPDGTPNPYVNDVLPSTSVWTDSSQFLPLVGSINTGAGNNDHTYQSFITKTYNATYNQIIGTNDYLLRKDSLLAVIVLTNGADITLDPNTNGIVSSGGLANYANQIKALRVNPDLVRFYSVAASQTTNPTYGTNCLGGSSLIGTSYSRMITDGLLPGLRSDLCNINSLQTVLASIASDIEIVREAFVRENLVLTQEPLPGTIKVYKNGHEIPENNTNGWNYGGGPQTVYTITGIMQSNGTVTAFNADQQTGYVIHLNGTAKMIGNDRPNITYQRP